MSGILSDPPAYPEPPHIAEIRDGLFAIETALALTGVADQRPLRVRQQMLRSELARALGKCPSIVGQHYHLGVAPKP